MFGIAGRPAVTQSAFETSGRHLDTFPLSLSFFWISGGEHSSVKSRERKINHKTKGGGTGANNAGSVGEEEKGISVRDDGKGQRAGIAVAKASLHQNSTAIITQPTCLLNNKHADRNPTSCSLYLGGFRTSKSGPCFIRVLVSGLKFNLPIVALRSFSASLQNWRGIQSLWLSLKQTQHRRIDGVRRILDVFCCFKNWIVQWMLNDQVKMMCRYYIHNCSNVWNHF